MSKSKKRVKSPLNLSPATPPGKRRLMIIAALLIGLLATGGALAQWTGIFSATQKQQGATIAPAGFTATTPTKEYIFDGGKLVATEEPASASCSYSIAPTSQNFTTGGGTASINVTATTGCNWTAVSNAAWVTITSGASGTGNGTVNYSVATNSGAQRNTTIAVAGQTFTVTQDGVPGCTYSISPTSASIAAGGGTGSVTVTTQAGCNWTAVSNAAWITVTSGASGTGNGTVNYSVANNASTSSRNGTVTIAGQTFTVNQAGSTPTCTYSISPTSQSIAAGGGTGSVTVTTQAGCAWTAVSNAAWITVTAGSSGTGNGTVSYSVAANSGAARNGTITIAGQTFTVNQAAGGGGSVPNAPTNLRTTSVTAFTCKLAWDHDGLNLTGFKVERKIGAGGTWVEIASNVSFSARSYADNTVMSGKTYFYRVRAYNNNGNSGYSNEVSATTP